MKVSAIAEGEIAREGRRVLRRLAADGAVLAQHPAGEYAVLVSGRMHPVARIAAPLVDAFHRRGWIVAPSASLREASPPMGEDESRASPKTSSPSGGGGAERQRGLGDLPTGADAKKVFILSDAGLGWLRRAMAEEGAFAAQHQLRVRRVITDEEGNERPVTVNEGESPLGWLRNRRGQDGKPLIDEIQLEAGEKLRRDYTLAQMTPRMAVDFAAPVIGGKRGMKADAPLSENVMAAKQRVRRALAFTGPGLAGLLIDVCCHLIGLEEAEREKGWPKRSGKIVLGLALDRLAEHYGLRPVARAGRRRIRAWHAPEEEEA